MKCEEDLFPELNRKHLSRFADYWAEQLSGIRMIVLRSAMPSDDPARFCVSFIPESEDAYLILYSEVMSIQNLATSYSGLIGGRSFLSVYRTEPDWQTNDSWRFRDDWVFEVLPYGKEFSEEGAWVLFSKELEPSKQNEPPPERENALTPVDKFDETIRRLRVWKESDEEIGFQIPNKSKHCFRHDVFGFRSSETDQWKAIHRCLSLEGVFTLSDIRPDNKDVNNRALLSNQINPGFLRVLHLIQPDLSIPSKSKIYRRVQKGKYALKFMVIPRPGDTIMAVPKPAHEYKNKLENLVLQWKDSRNQDNMDAADFYSKRIDKLAREAFENGQLSEAEIKQIIEPGDSSLFS